MEHYARGEDTRWAAAKHRFLRDQPASVLSSLRAAHSRGPVERDKPGIHGRFVLLPLRRVETLVADIANKKPDVILIASNAWLEWAQRHADVATALADYQLRETADDVMVYARANQEGR
jgi:hypothetical protein